MDPHVCHVWLGLFGPDAPETYFVQDYGRGDDDGSPLSRFGAEQGEHSFDYDFVEISFVSDPRPVRRFVEGHSYWESYIDAVAQAAAQLGIGEANVFVLADKDQFSGPRSVRGPGYQLWYLGEFACAGEG